MKTILVVEDNSDAREMLSLVLTREGFSVITAEDGLQALSLLRHPPPDLIVTDIQMPNLDGVELIRRVREQSRLRSVPILVMSAFGSGQVADAISAGADLSTPKPMRLDSLLSVINELLS